VFRATADEKYMLERLKAVDWKEDKTALSHLIAPSKTVAVMELLTNNKMQNE
jgi:hypothetical protein